jgi:hypothetical protein
MLYMRGVRSSIAYGHLAGLRIAEALAHRGAVAVWTAASTRRDAARKVIVAGSAGAARGAGLFSTDKPTNWLGDWASSTSAMYAGDRQTLRSRVP